MKKAVIYLNLTNGLEALTENIEDYKVIRIQSTACEQKRWDYILQDLDNGFLFDLAVGKECTIIDYSQKKEAPRALYQGVEWIKFVLYKVWFNKEYVPMVKEHNVTNYFMEEYKLLNNKTLNKIKYFRKFLNTDKLNLLVDGRKTFNDGNYNYYKNLLLKNNGN